jgi:GxxExxY protein
VIELHSRGYQVEQQKEVIVKYKDQVIGKHVLDLVVNERIILELKALVKLPLFTNSRLFHILKQQVLN